MTSDVAAPVGVIVGMLDEARCLSTLGQRVRVACSGARPALAQERAEVLVAAGVTALISFGTAGALVSGLPSGTLILPDGVVGDGTGKLDTAWRDRVCARAVAAGLPLLTGVTVAGSQQPVCSPAAKATLAARTGAVAVDMESHIVAAVAERFGLPFLVLRAIADPADRAIPPVALAGLGPEGETRPGAVALRLLMAPWALPALLRLAADSRASLAALTEAVTRLGGELTEGHS